ncbi:MAG: sensor histidine kinase KdpD [Oscillospiraceae bacterium]|nr:sensor histidine kinase KdpD [Oscillospiraceae bacterium]
MASAFGGSFTALYVQTPNSDKMDEASKRRLQFHIQLAEKLGATIATVYGEDVSFQIAEFVRISGVTKIVIGRSNVKHRHFWSKPTLTEKLSEIAPNLDIHIIPDSAADPKYKEKTQTFWQNCIPHPKDLLITLLLLVVSTLLGVLLFYLGFTDSNIIPVYILGVLLTSLFTRGYFCGIVSSLLSVMLFNFFFTEPRLTFHAHDARYTVTFAIMLAASIITGTLASKLKSHARLSAQAAFRTKVLLDTNQLLQKAQDDDDIFNITATQLMKLLNRSIVIYSAREGKLSKGAVFSVESEGTREELFSTVEHTAAKWVYDHRHRAGATTDTMSGAKCLYMAIRINEHVYGVVGIHINGKPLDAFENSILLSILGECALALDNNRNAKEKELAAVLAKNEQLRANLLRAISHDLRTPLTSISGNASNLLSNYDKLDEETRVQVFTDIFDDSQWLISLVENLLSVTRIEEGRMNFNMSVQLMDEIIDEAMKHINRKGIEHNITIDYKDPLLLARMDAKLIIQVIINLVDNAVKYTSSGSKIKITAENKDGFVSVSVADNGTGIPDHIKPRVFEMFYTGDNKVADSRRSLGLGLALCKSIIHAHGGEITLTDNLPHGSIFTFTIPLGEVNINE